MREAKSMMEKAKSIAKNASPADAWDRLKSWANTQNHPFAMKAAVFKFLEIHGTRAESAYLLPEVLKSASVLDLEKSERRDLIDLTERTCRAHELGVTPSQLPLSGNRPATILAVNPVKGRELNIYAPLTPSRDPNDMLTARDTLFRVNDMVLTQVKMNEKKRRTAD